MIAPNSTSYPVLAVIQHNHLTPDEAKIAYDFGQKLREFFCAGGNIAIDPAPLSLPLTVVNHLTRNMRLTAEAHGWL